MHYTLLSLSESAAVFVSICVYLFTVDVGVFFAVLSPGWQPHVPEPGPYLLHLLSPSLAHHLPRLSPSLLTWAAVLMLLRFLLFTAELSVLVGSWLSHVHLHHRHHRQLLLAGSA